MANNNLNLGVDLVPKTNATYILGSSSNKWNEGYINTIYTSTILAPTTSGSSTIAAGSAGQVLTSNGTSSYWGSASVHGYHVPTPETADNAKFLRNDNTWQTVTPANIGAATSTHTHSISIDTSTGTNAITLAASTKYSITAGGQSYIFTTPPNTTYSAATQSAAGLMSAADKKKLDGVATSANNYSHPTGAGNNHIPSGGSSGQFLGWSSAGAAKWVNNPNTDHYAWSDITSKPATATRWPTWSEVTSKPSTFTPASHSHDYIPSTRTDKGHSISAISAQALNNGDWRIFFYGDDGHWHWLDFNTQ